MKNMRAVGYFLVVTMITASVTVRAQRSNGTTLAAYKTIDVPPPPCSIPAAVATTPRATGEQSRCHLAEPLRQNRSVLSERPDAATGDGHSCERVAGILPTGPPVRRGRAERGPPLSGAGRRADHSGLASEFNPPQVHHPSNNFPPSSPYSAGIVIPFQPPQITGFVKPFARVILHCSS